MTDPTAYVCIELDGVTRPVGRLWAHRDRNRERASFEFDREWLADPVHHALGPALPPHEGAFHTAEGRALFGALGDSAPDRWGRRLITRNEALRARAAGKAPRAPREIDFLLGVTDIVRQGALRFRVTEGGPFVAPLEIDDRHPQVPPLIELPELLDAANALAQAPDSVAADNAVRLLLAPGSSLGGARPKASVRDHDGSLAIAKFPDRADDVDVIRWERVMLELARRAGVSVTDARLHAVGDSVVLIVRRFDRHGDERVPFLSAMSLLDAADGDQRSYVEIFDALRQIASAAAEDGAQLWRRLAFNILASNFDDHLRNHAVLYDGAAWRLSPAYDLNPVPAHVKPRELSTAINIDADTTASIELAVDAAPEFFVKKDGAKQIAIDVARALKEWRTVASDFGIHRDEVERMTSAFEHEDTAIVESWTA
jgi:serine/threonine-protein kinase HipA